MNEEQKAVSEAIQAVLKRLKPKSMHTISLAISLNIGSEMFERMVLVFEELGDSADTWLEEQVMKTGLYIINDNQQISWKE